MLNALYDARYDVVTISNGVLVPSGTYYIHTLNIRKCKWDERDQDDVLSGLNHPKN